MDIVPQRTATITAYTSTSFHSFRSARVRRRGESLRGIRTIHFGRGTRRRNGVLARYDGAFGFILATIRELPCAHMSR